MTTDADDLTRTSAGGHRFSLTAAAQATATSKRTLLRHMDALARHGATKDSTGAWSIPLASLLACGFTVNAPRTDDTAPEHAPPSAPGAPADLTALRTEVAALRAELLDAEHRAAIAAEQRNAALALAAERAAHVDSSDSRCAHCHPHRPPRPTRRPAAAGGAGSASQHVSRREHIDRREPPVHTGRITSQDKGMLLIRPSTQTSPPLTGSVRQPRQAKHQRRQQNRRPHQPNHINHNRRHDQPPQQPPHFDASCPAAHV